MFCEWMTLGDEVLLCIHREGKNLGLERVVEEDVIIEVMMV
jgi:hypothetical protein